MPSPLSELPDVPLIPPEVYASRDRGDLVLFCGAGVSVDAGCPLFSKLASRADAKFGNFGAIEDDALTNRKFDEYFQLVEQRLDRGPTSGLARRFVEEQLNAAQGPTSIHQSILRIARSPKGYLRLVTTNYDRHFLTAAQSLNWQVRVEYAPRLAQPEPDRWNSIVHLHGGLDGGDLRDLVLTSGDFGRAYITERWASRFVTELFERFDVLFLGYSADDVVMRYLLDAYAARQDRKRKGVWAISAPEKGENVDAWARRWKHRDVHLIAYNSKDRHCGFATALAEWASIVESPASRAQQVANILNAGVPNLGVANGRNQLAWLLGDSSGDGARSLLLGHEIEDGVRISEWLDILVETGLLEQRAERTHTASDESRIARSPLVGWTGDQLRLGDRALAFANWLVGVAADGATRANGRSRSEELLDWLQRGGREAALHPDFAEMARRSLSRSGGGLPSALQGAWQLVLDPSINARLSPPLPGEARWSLERALTSGPADDLTDLRLLHALAPVAIFRNESTAVRARVMFREFKERLRAKNPDDGVEDWQPRRHDFALPEIVPHCGAAEAEHLLSRLSKSQARDALLRRVAIGANALLERALELLSRTQPVFDYGECLQYPRVGALADPSRRSAWTLFADLAWHAGTELDRAQDRRARALYEAWLGGPHATQRRLALCAAASWTHLTLQDRIAALEGGAPAWLERGALASELLELLRRLKRDGTELGELFIARLQELEQKAAIKKSSPEPDEDVGFIAPPAPVDVTNATVDLLADLMLNKTDFTSREGRTGGELEVLVKRGESRRLLEAIELALTKYQPKPTLEIAGGRVLDVFPDRAARYLLAIAEHEEKSESANPIKHDELLALWDKVEPVAMGADRGGMADSSREELTKALNHPAGKLAQALFAILMPRSVQYRSSHDERLKERLERNVTKPGAAGRAFLAIASSRLFVLHYAEPQWAATALVPHFDWKKDEDLARTCWQGYLWAPQLNADLYAELRGAFLDTFKRADQLGEFAESLCGLLVSLALDGGDVLRPEDTRRALRDMPETLRSTVVWQLGNRAKEAETGAAELARTKILPWLRTWPLDAKVWHNDKLADRLAQLALKSGDAIGDMVGVLVQHSELKLGSWPTSLHSVLREHADLFAQHSHDIARLFDHVLPSREDNLRLGGQVWAPGELQQLVDKLREAGEPVTGSPEFKRLEARL